MKLQRGFSITELLMVSAIIGVLSGLGTPQLMRSLRTYRLSSGSQQIAQTLQLAKMEAIRTNNRAQIRFDTALHTLQLVNYNGGTAALQATLQLPPGIEFTALPTTISVPATIATAVANAANIPGQQTNNRLAVSFATASGYRVASFSSRGLPANNDGTMADPGLVNWLYLKNAQSEFSVVIFTSAGQSQKLRWNKATNSWMS